MPTMKTTQQMRDELLLRGRKEVLPFEKDSTTMPIPSTFGGLKTTGRLFHGGTWEGLIADKQGAIVGGRPATSFTRNPYEALEYASQPGGKVVSVSQRGLKIYRGGNPDLDRAYMSQGAQAVARAGYDGVDVRALTGGGYNEVVVWNHEKVKDVHTAPVETRMEGMALAQPFQNQFKQWFGNSVVADKRGRPKPVYHSTDQQFSVFKTDGLGFHVGTKGQARDIGGSRMIKAYVSLQNPLRMPDMGERWDSAPRMTDALLDQGTLTDEEGAAITGQPRERQLQALKDLLISKGHDGIVYENEHEGRGGDSYLLFHPHQIKATTNKAPTMSPDIHMAAGGSVQRMRDELLLKGMAGGGAVKAPVTRTGFYSPLEEAALNIQRKSGNAQAFMNDLRSVPKEHLQHADVDKLLTSRPTITREELQKHVARTAPKVEVKVLGEDDSDEDSQTKYSEYQLPGGQNYREVLLTLPKEKPQAYLMSVPGPGWTTTNKHVVSYRGKVHEFNTAEQAREFQKSIDPGPDFKSNHWDDPNVLAHFRINDRTDKDGKKVLFVEEIQSDWGQEGKKKGFASGYQVYLKHGYTPVANALFDKKSDAEEFAKNIANNPPFVAAFVDKPRDGVPAAPFVTKTNDWVNLALKHIMKMAAEEGHDRVAFVKGEQAADRFSLDKHFSQIQARPVVGGGFEIHTTARDGSRESSVNVPPNKLHEYVGEDLAKKIQQQGGGTFDGDDLIVPNTGMRKFYDELVPAQAHALVKRFGGQGIKPIPLPTPPKVDPYKGLSIEPDDGKFAVTLDGHVIEQHPSEDEAREAMQYIDPGFWRGEIEAGGFRRINRPPETYQGFDITPEMRQAILKPMAYAKGGAVPTMDEMRLQVWDKRRGR